MNFKELVRNDIAAFINPEEFGELITWDGIEVNAVIDEDGGERKKLATASKSEQYFDYLSKKTIIVFISEESIEEPIINQFVEMNNTHYKVIDCSKNSGLLTITLEVND